MARILALSNMYPPHHYGGYELSCRDVMQRFRERGHDTAVLTTTMRVPGVADPAGEDADGVWRWLRFAWEDHVLTNPGLIQRVRDERHNQRMLAKALERFRPDVVSVWNMGAMSMGLLETLARRRIPVILNICDEWLNYGPRLDPWTRLWMSRPVAMRRAVSALTRVPVGLPDLSDMPAMANSEFMRERNASQTLMPPSRWAISWTGIDERDFPMAPESEGRDRPWRWRMLGVGRIDDRKGIDVAIRALTHLPEEATLRWIGGGDEIEKQRLVQLADELGVTNRVSWDVKAREELRAEYSDADVFVFPSTWDEPFGLVPVEAMACNTPVVGTGTGGSQEFLIDGVTALISPPGDDRALADAVRRLATDSALRDRVVRGGRKAAAELNIENLASMLEAWHIAAATGYPEGDPPPRTLDLE
ncbi:MAG: glycogen synthase [Actinomycetota bacterium]|jgi:glycosyltransferase involved in cell wall biosynthesis